MLCIFSYRICYAYFHRNDQNISIMLLKQSEIFAVASHRNVHVHYACIKLFLLMFLSSLQVVWYYIIRTFYRSMHCCLSASASGSLTLFHLCFGDIITFLRGSALSQIRIRSIGWKEELIDMLQQFLAYKGR